MRLFGEERYLDEGDPEEGLEIEDSARLTVQILKRIKPSLQVMLESLRIMTKYDDDRHESCEINVRLSHGACGNYDRFLGSQLLIDCLFGEGFDFGALSSTERKALVKGLAEFREVEIRSKLLELALGWIRQVAEPLNKSSMRTQLIDVQQMCQMLASPPQK